MHLLQLHLGLNHVRSSSPEVFCKKGVLKTFAKFTGKHLCQSLFFNKVAGFKNTFFYRTPPVAASVIFPYITESFLTFSNKKFSIGGPKLPCPQVTASRVAFYNNIKMSLR